MAGRICISHRREDDPGFTQALCQVLEQEFPAGDVVADAEGKIRPGDDFVAGLKRQVAACDVLLVVIGQRWADLTASRAKADDDFPAILIKAALDQDKRVIPVLVGGAAMPRAAALPEAIGALASRHAVHLRPEHFKADCLALAATLKEQFAEIERKRAPRRLGERIAAEVERRKREGEDSPLRAAAEEEASDTPAAAGPPPIGRSEEELNNWLAIRERGDERALRDHLARFPKGGTAQLARTRLEEQVWLGLGPSPDIDALEEFLDEFPKGAHSPTARAQLAILMVTWTDFGSLVDRREMQAAVQGRARAHGRLFRWRINPAGAWRYYVDVLAALLLVLTFLLSVLAVERLYAASESSGKDSVLRRLTRQIAELTNLSSLEKSRGKSLQDELGALQASIAMLRADNERLAGQAGLGGAKDARIAALTRELSDRTALSAEAQAKVDLLDRQLRQLRQQMAARQESIGAWEVKDRESQARIAGLGAQLNAVLAKQVQAQMQERDRSDFFGRLRELLRDRKDVRVVGDRFVFQAEALFPPGQATMTAEGLATIDRLATAIVGLERAIPRETDWMLRVEGHTDVRPIASAQFPSNWELSSARATTVVKHLIGRGVSPRRLAAAGGGEFQPLEEGTAEDVLRRNSRIELELTHR